MTDNSPTPSSVRSGERSLKAMSFPFSSSRFHLEETQTGGLSTRNFVASRIHLDLSKPLFSRSFSLCFSSSAAKNVPRNRDFPSLFGTGGLPVFFFILFLKDLIQ